MNVNLNEIILTQIELDNFIEKNHKLLKKNLLSRKRLALIVELSELCNEVRCFKFWSLKKSSHKDVILDEFVDCLHFILSIGLFYGVNEMKFSIKTSQKKKKDKIQLSKSFTELITNVSSLNNEKKVRSFIKKLFQLAIDLDLTFHEIKKAYYSKNQVNINRQKENY
ncbi:MAG: dUTP diphosphatase [Mycoplasmoidaceae bacterium]